MKNKKLSKSGEKFGFGVFIILLATSLSLFAFITKDKDLVGLAASNLEKYQEVKNIKMHDELKEFKDAKSLETLAPGSYYIGSEGIVYWADDESMPPVGKIKALDESQKQKMVYIDDNGRIGYVLNAVK